MDTKIKLAHFVCNGTLALESIQFEIRCNLKNAYLHFRIHVLWTHINSLSLSLCVCLSAPSVSEGIFIFLFDSLSFFIYNFAHEAGGFGVLQFCVFKGEKAAVQSVTFLTLSWF